MKSIDKIKSGILYLDDEQANLEVFKVCFQDDFDVFIANTAKEAWDVLNKHEIKVLISDQRMPEISGLEFISEVRPHFPDIIPILLTGYIDNNILLHAINNIGLFRYITKPWEALELKLAITNAINKYNEKKEKQKLLYDLQISQAKALEVNRLKTALLQNLSHELRTPLNAILGFTSLLSTANLEQNKMNHFFECIENSTEQLLKILDDLFTKSCMQTAELKSNVQLFNINEFLNSLGGRFKMLLKDKPITLTSKGQINCNCNVETDKTKLYEVFSQLLYNAIKFTNKGQIEFGIKSLHDRHFYVKDTGIGISKSSQKAIFQSFRKIHEEDATEFYPGSGLGLSIVQGLIEMVGGEIWLESEKGAGSIFHFIFPVKLIEQSCVEKTGVEHTSVCCSAKHIM